MKHITRSSAGTGRGISQKIGAVTVIIKPHFDQLVAQLQTFKFPTLWTLDDLLPICGLSTNADRVHLSRALRRAGVMPVGGKKITLTDPTSKKEIRAYIWCVGKVPAGLKTKSAIRREYYRQRYDESIARIKRIQQQIASQRA